MCKLISSWLQHGRTLSREPERNHRLDQAPLVFVLMMESRMDIYGGGAGGGHTERHPPTPYPHILSCGGSAESRGWQYWWTFVGVQGSLLA